MNADSAESSASVSCFMRRSARDAGPKLLRVHGLGQEVVCPGFDPSNPIRQLRQSSDQDDRRQASRRIRFEPAAHLDSVHARHADIGEDDIRMMRLTASSASRPSTALTT